MMTRLSHLMPSRTVAVVAALVLGLGALSGCGDGFPADMAFGVRTDPLVVKRPEGSPPSFGRPGEWPYLLPAFKEAKGEILDPAQLTADQRAQLDRTLTELFGTPAAPRVKPIEGVDAEALKELRLDEATLAAGSRLYRRHCLHCHGLTGDGHGPTAAWVNPHPRDFRPGKFKFTSSSQPAGTRKPRRDDLLRVLRNGIEGTAMPAFGLLPEDELQKLASYVTFLSIRGQCEFDAIPEAVASKLSPRDIDQRIRELLIELAGNWREANDKAITPSVPNELVPAVATRDENRRSEAQASIVRGFKLFMGATGGTSCISCHKDFGRQPNLLYDDWGTVVRPADLTAGIYRGGRRPIDIFWRIHSGVNGAGMPAFPDPPKGKTQQDVERDMWDVVNFVLALPYPAMLPPEVRAEVYGTESAGQQTAAAD